MWSCYLFLILVTRVLCNGKDPDQQHRYFIHYFENGAKTYSEAGGHRIANEAWALTVDGNPFFDHVITYRKRDLGNDFVARHAQHFSQSRGAGLWVWKPRIVQMTLERMNDGDVLVYADTGCQWNKAPTEHFKWLDKQDVVPFGIGLPEAMWTKGDVFHALDAVHLMDTYQRMATYLIVRKTLSSVGLINEWVRWAQDFHLLSDEPSVKENHPTFRDHRHDQSLWSLLTKLHNIQEYGMDEAGAIVAARLAG